MTHIISNGCWLEKEAEQLIFLGLSWFIKLDKYPTVRAKLERITNVFPDNKARTSEEHRENL